MTHDELRKLAEQATPGPWEADTRETCTCGDPNAHGTVRAGAWHIAECTRTHSKSAEVIPSVNARYIAAASPDVVIGLLDEIKRLTAERDDIVRQHEALMSAILAAAPPPIGYSAEKVAEVEAIIQAHKDKAVPRG